MKPPPKDWPRMSSAIFCADAMAEIEFMKQAFGFAAKLVVPGEDGKVLHSQLTYGGGLVMVASAGASPRPTASICRSPQHLDGSNTQSLMLYVDDVDAHCAHAREHGAEVVMEPETMNYGDEYWTDRSYECVDPEGHHWWFVERIKTAGD